MKLKKYKVQCFFYFLLFFLLNSTNASQRFDSNLVAYSLFLQNQTIDIEFPVAVQKIESDLIGINWYESFGKTFYGGLEFGYIDVTHSDNSSSQFSSGEFIGVLLRFLPFEYSFASLAFDLNYRYHKTEVNNLNLTSEFLWHRTLFITELEIHAYKTVGFVLAAEYQNISGKQRTIGNVQAISPFSASKHLGYRFGIRFRPDPTAEISLEGLTGSRKGARITFKRGF